MAESFTLSCFAELLAEKLETPKGKTLEACKEAFESMAQSVMDGNKANLHAFGTFTLAEKAERQGRNPRTGETITIPAKKEFKFKAAKSLRDAANTPKGKKKK